MRTLVRWSPVREMMNLQNDMDRLFGQVLADKGFMNDAENWGIPVDVVEKEAEFVVKASIPGINPEELEITVIDNVLTIKGETKSDESHDNDHYHIREHRYGSFSRIVNLRTPIDGDAVTAVSENGVVTLTLPKVAAVQPKKIMVKPTATFSNN